MIRLICIGITIGSIVLLGSCGDDTLMNSGRQSPTPQYLGHGDPEEWLQNCCGLGDTLAVDSGFQVRFGKTPFDTTLSAHRQYIRINTNQWYSMSNQFLITHVFVAPARIRIEIIGVQSPGFLFLPLFKQSEITEYFHLDPARYEVEISYERSVSRFRLIVTDSTIVMREEYQSEFKLSYGLFWRYKPNTCAFVCGMGLTDSSACDVLLDTVLTSGSFRNFAYPDSGVRPFPTGTSGNWINWGAQYLEYDSEEDGRKAGEVLHAFAKAHWAWNSGNTAFLINYRGDQYRSWFP